MKRMTSDVTYADMNTAIAMFCAATKKWELPHRLKIFESEMAGYNRLVNEFGRDVAKGSFIIPEKHEVPLVNAMLAGLAKKDWVEYQYGLKGLQKIKLKGVNPESSEAQHHLWEHRAGVANTLLDNTPRGLSKERDYPFITNFIVARANAGHGVGYHELNALADYIAGERVPTAAPAIPDAPALRLGVAPPIPHYAHDNHTWAGKALLRRYPTEFAPGADQKHFDLRMCGAYMGVAWRYLAYSQFNKIDVPWGSVKWPKPLHETVSLLWY
jgi:hypothetical protein